MKAKITRVLAVSSGGGHWVQMMRLRPAFAGFDVTFASVDPDRAADVAPAPFHAIPDANRMQKWKLLVLLVKLGWIMLKTRPHVVITTGAAPGYFAIRMGRVLGARTLFLDSVANAEKLSLSAHLSQRHADLMLTQWPDVAERTGSKFMGSVI